MILYLLADVIFLLVQGFLFLLGDMTMILGSHGFFLMPDLMIFVMQLTRFSLAHFTVGYFFINSVVLVG